MTNLRAAANRGQLLRMDESICTAVTTRDRCGITLEVGERPRRHRGCSGPSSASAELPPPEPRGADTCDVCAVQAKPPKPLACQACASPRTGSHMQHSLGATSPSDPRQAQTLHRCGPFDFGSDAAQCRRRSIIPCASGQSGVRLFIWLHRPPDEAL